MAVRTLLQIVNAVQQELGLPVSTSVVGNTDLTTVQLLAFANQEVEELRQRHNWTFLQNEFDLVVNTPIITTGDVTQNSATITGIPTTAGLVAQYWQVAGAGIPLAARIISVDSPTQVTLSMECTSTVAGTPLTFSQDTYAEPSDFDHFIGNTWWDRTNHWSLLGPTSPQDDQWHRSGIFATGPRRYFRQSGPYANNYRIWPPPSELVEPLQLVFEYVSNAPILTGGNVATRNRLWTTDTDTSLIDDRAIIMGIKWRIWEQKGFAWASKRTDYDNYVDRLVARDGGNKTLSLVPRENNVYLTSANVQDGYFPGPTGTNSN